MKRSLTLVPALLLVVLLLAAAACVLYGLSPSAPEPRGAWGFRGFEIVFALAFGIVGGLIAARRRDNPIGWIFLAAAVANGIQAVCDQYARLALDLPRPMPFAPYAAWIVGWIWLPGTVLTTALFLLLFPNGRLVSPRWRAYVWLSILLVTVGTVLSALTPGPIQNFADYSNPFLPGQAGLVGALAEASLGLFAVPSVIGVVSLFVRYRRSGADVRQQLKWLAYSGVLVLAGVILVSLQAFATQAVADLFEAALILGFLSVPVATAVAVLRYRLYDIDRLINRTLVYAALTALVAAAYALGVLLLGTLFRPLTQGSDLAIALTTLAVVGLFGRARRRVQGVIDRRFDRARYDAALTLNAFRGRLRQHTDLDELTSELSAVVSRTMQPSHVAIWLRRPDGQAVPAARRGAGS